MRSNEVENVCPLLSRLWANYFIFFIYLSTQSEISSYLSKYVTYSIISKCVLSRDLKHISKGKAAVMKESKGTGNIAFLLY